MSEKASISLSKALKLKNRLAGRLAAVTRDITYFNSVLKEKEGQVDIKKALETRAELIDAIIGLKTALYQGNVGVQRQLYTLGERRSEIQFYGSINTRDGAEKHDYENTNITYSAYLKKNDVDAKVRALEAEIDKLQDEVDTYNYSTKIEVRQRILDLAS